MRKSRELNEREAEYIQNREKTSKAEVKETQVVEEHMQVGQGNLVLGLNINAEH